MTKYLISFPGEAMVLTDEEFPVVVAESHAVIAQAKAAGVYVFGAGIDEEVAPVLVSADGAVSHEIYPGSVVKGGFTVLELPTRAEAVEWALACHRSRVFPVVPAAPKRLPPVQPVWNIGGVSVPANGPRTRGKHPRAVPRSLIPWAPATPARPHT